jgi:glycosyltransferase involved in cell wall biosynthesis
MPHHRTNPLVSIIIPSYNAQSFVADAIESALHQTYPHREVIVIDDGSNDGGVDVLRRFGSSIRSETGPHRGGGAARNRGLALARGEFIQFLDADDVLLPGCVARKVAARMASPDICPCSDWIVVDEPGNETRHRPSAATDDPVVGMLSGQTQTSSPLHRREDLVKINGFDEDLTCSQDRDVHLRLACTGIRFSHIAEVLHIVRRRQSSVSSDYTRVLLQRGPVFCRIRDTLATIGRLTPERRFAIAQALAVDGRRLFHRGHIQEARERWRFASELDPDGLGAAYRLRIRGLLNMLGPERTEGILMALRRSNHTSPTA